MATQVEQFSSQAPSEVLMWMREAAKRQGRLFDEVLEDAMRSYLENQAQQQVRPEVMAHFRASLEKNRLLYELLGQ